MLFSVTIKAGKCVRYGRQRYGDWLEIKADRRITVQGNNIDGVAISLY